MEQVSNTPIESAVPSTHMKGYRIISIDLLRGIAMIIMALDHVRDYFHSTAQLYRPLDLSHTTVPIFFTRWITHFCAPVFMFLAGTSAYLIGQRKAKRELSFFLFTRGMWLMVLDLTVVGFGWTFNIQFPIFFFDVLWALGVSMTVLSMIIYLPLKVILLLGILIIAGHNLLDNFHVAGNDFKAFIWSDLHDARRTFQVGKRTLRPDYPVLPWIGIILLGYCFGIFYEKNFGVARRKKWLIWLGAGAIVLFVILRVINVYGDLHQWSIQKNAVFTFLSFISVAKYPPSLLYTLITLGPPIIFLAFAEKPLNETTSFISVFGRVPMFYYLIHIYLIHALAMLATIVTGFTWSAMVTNDYPVIKGYGFPLIFVYLIWIVVILALYPWCKRYDKYKSSHKEKWWLSYL